MGVLQTLQTCLKVRQPKSSRRSGARGNFLSKINSSSKKLRGPKRLIIEKDFFHDRCNWGKWIHWKCHGVGT